VHYKVGQKTFLTLYRFWLMIEVQRSRAAAAGRKSEMNDYNTVGPSNKKYLKTPAQNPVQRN